MLGREQNRKSDLEKDRKGERGGREVEGVEGEKRGEEIPKECIVSKHSTRYKNGRFPFPLSSMVQKTPGSLGHN